MEALKIFEYQQQEVRTVILENGEVWFVAKDVCDVLGLRNSRKAISLLDDDQKGVTVSYTPGGKQEMNIVDESGVYELIFRSNKPEAKAFRKWVTSEVLPTLRKTGRYDMSQDISERLQAMAEQIRVKDMLLQEADREKARLREQVQNRQDMVETLSRYAEKNTEKNMLPAGRRRQEMVSATTRVPIKKVKYIQKLANQGRGLEDISEIVGMKYERVCQVLSSLEV